MWLRLTDTVSERSALCARRPGCTDLQLALLTEEEATVLLHDRTGLTRTPRTDQVCVGISKLCGMLPLFVGMTGQVISDYVRTDPEDRRWEVEVAAMLKENRSALLGGAPPTRVGDTGREVAVVDVALGEQAVEAGRAAPCRAGDAGRDTIDSL